ncbi:MAG: histidine phosphatase family protein [Pseudomonadales bacterium]|nr:histidine phosphatase family protein [Pseudomonadales bacterium]
MLFLFSVYLTTHGQGNVEENGPDLIEALQSGGLVVIMRHAQSPAEPPQVPLLNNDNFDGERQLDATGRQQASAMGDALERLQIDFGLVLSSPAYRTLETAKYLGFDDVEERSMLGNQGMQASSDTAGEWLREQTKQVPDSGNTLLITHSPNVASAFPDLLPTIQQGEILLFDPQRPSQTLLGRISIDQWEALQQNN